MNHRKNTARILTPEPGGAIRRPSQLVLDAVVNDLAALLSRSRGVMRTESEKR